MGKASRRKRNRRDLHKAVAHALVVTDRKSPTLTVTVRGGASVVEMPRDVAMRIVRTRER